MRVTGGQVQVVNESGDQITVDLASRRIISGGGHVYTSTTIRARWYWKEAFQV